MSTRALRKLHGGQDLAHIEVTNESDEELENSQPVKNSKKGRRKKKGKTETAPVNPFDLLGSEENEVEDDAKEINEDHGDDEECKENLVTNEGDAAVTESTKKKRAKKKRKKNQSQDNKDGGNIPSEDEIEASVRQVNEMLGEVRIHASHTSSGPGPSSAACRALLSIEHKNLNPDNEMKRIFGSRVVQTDQSRNQGNHHGNRRHRKTVRKTSWLVQTKDTWPHLGKTGLSMEVQETGNSHFIFVHNKEYQKVQFQFLEAVESIDPQNIINMANMYPHHVDTLLQVSEICRMSDDMQMATDFIERALYVFEGSFHPLFSLTQGTARLEYKYQENRAFFIALFRHLQYVGKRGCYRTSLEFCKLLLSLDPDADPMCVLLMIDFYALHAQQYDFLIQLYSEWETHRNLSQLPNFAMSVPLAMYHQAEKDNTDLSTADHMLQNCLLMFPGLLITLLDKCNISPDARVSSHSFFGPKAQIGQPKALEQLIALYVGRTFSCWKSPEVMAWLERNVQEVLDRVDHNDPLVKDFANKRQARYRGTPRNIHRHIMMSEIKEATAALPPDMAHTPVMSYDPLPPSDSVSAYTRPSRPNRAQSNSNTLSMFFQSLLPNFNPQEVIEPDQGAAGGGEGQNFRAGVTQVMEAMRELLSNIQPVAPPVENGDHQDPEDNGADPDWD